MTTLLESHGFTNATLDWKAWLDTVQLDQATPVQMQVLESSINQSTVSGPRYDAQATSEVDTEVFEA